MQAMADDNSLQIVPATGYCKNVEAQYVEMMVPLYSFGCERKIKKALSQLKGIYSVSVDYKLQKVTVWGICNRYDLLATIRSKRKGSRFWETDDNEQVIDSCIPNSDHDDDEGNVERPTKTKTSAMFSRSMSMRPQLMWTLGRSLSWKAVKKMVRMKSF